jgi:hypothetical protein
MVLNVCTEIDLIQSIDFKLLLRFLGEFEHSPELDRVSESQDDKGDVLLGMVDQSWMQKVNRNHANDDHENRYIDEVHLRFEEGIDSLGRAPQLPS